MAVATNAQQLMMVPIVEVAYPHGQWWALPQNISAGLFHLYASGQDAIYTWDWGPFGRAGSFKPNAETTSISRYHIDFAAWTQTNMDNQRKRSIRLVWVRPQDVVANFTGELPAQ